MSVRFAWAAVDRYDRMPERTLVIAAATLRANGVYHSNLARIDALTK
jgi:hypothetical protein